MSNLKGSEKFVANSLKSYFEGKGFTTEYKDGGDPPDIFLEINNQIKSVEITNIDENRLNNRRTINMGYLSFIKNLNKEFSSMLSPNKSILIFFFHHYKKISNISKEFKKYFIQILNNKLSLTTIEDTIKGVNFKIIVFDTPNNKKATIKGAVTTYGGRNKSRNLNDVINRINDCNLDMKTSNIILDAITDKNEKCKHLNKPIYLALYDDFSNKYFDFDNKEHINHYKNAMKEIDFMIFEKIFIIFDTKEVLEFQK